MFLNWDLQKFPNKIQRKNLEETRILNMPFFFYKERVNEELCVNYKLFGKHYHFAEASVDNDMMWLGVAC